MIAGLPQSLSPGLTVTSAVDTTFMQAKRQLSITGSVIREAVDYAPKEVKITSSKQIIASTYPQATQWGQTTSCIRVPDPAYACPFHKTRVHALIRLCPVKLLWIRPSHVS